MIWLLFLALAALALAPLVVALFRAPRLTDRHAADLALYGAQLAELDREREAGRLDTAGHRAATLEVQRRLLAAPDAMRRGEVSPGAGRGGVVRSAGRGTATLAAMVFLIPAAGFGLYLWHGQPDIPAAPFVERAEATARDNALLDQLRSRLALADPRSEGYRQGYILLGNAERGRGRIDAATEAWTRALNARFDGALATELAEMQIQAGQAGPAAALLARALALNPGDARLRYLSGLADQRQNRFAEARATWQALLAETPADAPWRALVEQRLRELP